MAVTDPDNAAVPAHVDVHRARPTRPASRSSATSASATSRASTARTPTSATRTCACRREHARRPRRRRFVVAQTRLGGGRIHHAMRTVGQVQQAFDMMCERARLAHTQGEMLGAQADGAGDDRRLVDRDRAVPPARAADRVEDRQVQGLQAGAQGHLRGQGDDAARCSTTSPRARCRSTARSACRTRCRSPSMLIESFHMGLADGPTEVHKVTVARGVLERVQGRPTDCSRPGTSRRCARRALARYADVIERHVGNL